MEKNAINPITRLDYPDADVIRVNDTYYMVSTTMHFMPGCEILRSYDLVNWEHATYVYDYLDSTPAQSLTGDESIYGKGMWAASIRYHKGLFYVCFVANDTGKTYLYTCDSIYGSWKKSIIEGFYHDCSLLFDDDDRVYIVYGNKHIYLTELKSDLSGPLEGGLHRMVVSDEGNPSLGYEGAHFYKIKGKYYLFFIHSLRDRWMRTEACFMSDSLEGEFVGGDVLVDHRGYCNQGVAQGGIVDTPEGNWYAILFQDHGAVGRIPVLLPVSWQGDWPVFGLDGHIPEIFPLPSSRPDYSYESLVNSDDFKASSQLSSPEDKVKYGCFGLKSMWQFNHEPDLALVHRDTANGVLWIETGKLCQNPVMARNMLTQRMLFPGCSGEVTVDVSHLKEGDYAGLCALQGCYGMIAVTKRNGQNYIVMQNREAKDNSLFAPPKDLSAGKEWESVFTNEDKITLKISVDFWHMKDEAEFFYLCQGKWKKIGPTHKLYFKMDHFTGCRFGLFTYATKETGGKAGFLNFVYNK